MTALKKYNYEIMDDGNALSMVTLVREGISYYGFNSIIKHTPFSSDEWSSYLHMSERTLQRYKKEKKKFDAMQSERIIQITQLYNYGSEVFGNEEKFDKWLSTENVALGNTVPKSLLDSSFGISMLKDELGRIEYGILA
ncbi:type II RES/Xre toxin-antitoxin system antitoxin [Portibacter lacus]|uniref:DUF2384 domain-containing protein n=1 Tax=Portibacter lacus TaxID=1099794 RepID=A0AA37WEK4_9BACT|nr:antitoxin Xre/MbcA/ParS toxin-binding domain-containing protein [Portibacter lacus]GLR16185.1 hypothetical protein GCM10007940_08000 [Portibacter lacus]